MKLKTVVRNLTLSVAYAATLLPGTALKAGESAQPLYQRADVPVAQRVRDLLGRMTLEEKVAQLESLSNIPVGPGAVALFKDQHVDALAATRAMGHGIGTFSITVGSQLEPDVRSGAQSQRVAARMKW
jgi:beta-glucosidase